VLSSPLAAPRNVANYISARRRSSLPYMMPRLLTAHVAFTLALFLFRSAQAARPSIDAEVDGTEDRSGIERGDFDGSFLYMVAGQSESLNSKLTKEGVRTVKKRFNILKTLDRTNLDFISEVAEVWVAPGNANIATALMMVASTWLEKKLFSIPRELNGDTGIYERDPSGSDMTEGRRMPKMRLCYWLRPPFEEVAAADTDYIREVYESIVEPIAPDDDDDTFVPLPDELEGDIPHRMFKVDVELLAKQLMPDGETPVGEFKTRPDSAFLQFDRLHSLKAELVEERVKDKKILIIGGQDAATYLLQASLPRADGVDDSTDEWQMINAQNMYRQNLMVMNYGGIAHVQWRVKNPRFPYHLPLPANRKWSYPYTHTVNFGSGRTAERKMNSLTLPTSDMNNIPFDVQGYSNDEIKGKLLPQMVWIPFTMTKAKFRGKAGTKLGWWSTPKERILWLVVQRPIPFITELQDKRSGYVIWQTPWGETSKKKIDITKLRVELNKVVDDKASAYYGSSLTLFLEDGSGKTLKQWLLKARYGEKGAQETSPVDKIFEKQFNKFKQYILTGVDPVD